MHLVCVTTSVNYADFLKYTLPLIKPHVDKHIVLTTSADDETTAVCQANQVNFRPTNAFYHDGATFNRGRAYLEGMRKLKVSETDWILFLDADIIVPGDFRKRLEKANLKERRIYGAPRVMCKKNQAWQNFLASGDTKGLRPKNDKKYGSIPGYFQLFHMSIYLKLWRKYPNHPDVDRVDLKFSKRWGKKSQAWFSFNVIHLGPERVNWRGRKSSRFE